MKELSNKELATGLGAPAPRITEWIKRGMPRTSIAAATAWRLVHARPRKGKAAFIAQSRQDKPKGNAPQDTATLESMDWEARLDRARKTEIEIHKTLMAALGAGDLNVLGRLQAAHISSVREIANAEKIALEVRLASKELIHVSEAVEILQETLGPLRQRLDALPMELRGRCNPERPEAAFEALTEWVKRTLLLVAKAEEIAG
jgi:hypothetical protein